MKEKVIITKIHTDWTEEQEFQQHPINKLNKAQNLRLCRRMECAC